MVKLSEWFTSYTRWCQGTSARDFEGDETSCSQTNRNMCSMCLYGALFALLDHDQFEVAVRRVRQIIGTESIGGWNDQPGRTFEEVQSVVNQLEAA